MRVSNKPIRAAGKIKREKRRQEAQKALENDAGKLEVHASTKVRMANHIPMRELKGVIARTVKRVMFEEFGTEIDDLNAREFYAQEIARELRYGPKDDDGYIRLDGGLPMREHEYSAIPLCKDCKSG